MEGIAQRNDVRIDLVHVDACGRQMLVAEFGQRSSAQAHHGDAPRIRVEQQKRHHDAGVFQIERRRVLRPHAALDFRVREHQRPRRRRGVHERPNLLIV
ncbi:hypothetical protein D3C73_1090610 [compost metagenome]